MSDRGRIEVPVVLLCATCGGFLGCSVSLMLSPRYNEVLMIVPGHRDVSLVYGGSCDCTKVPSGEIVLENGEDGS